MLKGTLPGNMEALLWAYGYGKPRDTVDLNVSAERKTLIIVPHPGVPKPEDEKPAVDEPVSTLALPADPPLRLLPSKSEPKTYGPPSPCGLDPISWTLSERRIRCPRWCNQPRIGAHAAV